MARISNTDKLAKLHRQMEQLTAQARALEARESEKKRKDDTRRKVIAGALAIEHMEKNAGGAFADQLKRLLNEYVTRPSDRALFPALDGVAAPPGNVGAGKAAGAPAGAT